MSSKYPGGIITKNYTAPTPTSASGIWTLDQQEQAQQAGIWPYGGPFTYIEDVFSTWLYKPTGATLAINNGIDLSTNGGLTLTKCRTDAGSVTTWTDTVRGATKWLSSTNTNSQNTTANTLTSFNSNGFTLGADTTGNFNYVYTANSTYASWTFRKQPKFFDIVTYTGNNSTNRVISHNLGSAPGFILIKAYDSIAAWYVYHRSLSTNYLMRLNTTAEATADASYKINTVTSTTFSIQGGGSDINGSGVNFVAYLFAHDAGGFGLTGTDNVSSCGSFTPASGVDSTVTLGYEPQWLLIKKSTAPGSDWRIIDTMRGMVVSTSTSDDASLFPNLSDVESVGNILYPTATGFVVPTTSTIFDVGATYVYVAIRRGPMKVPTVGTTVFSPVASASGGGTITTGFVTDSSWSAIRAGNSNISEVASRLTGWQPYLRTASTGIEQNTGTNKFKADNNTGFTDTLWSGIGSSIYWNFQRAPGFFDVVCDTGTGAAHTVSHNLRAVPTLLIRKNRSGTVDNWIVSCAYDGFSGNADMRLNQTSGASSADSTLWNSTAPTSTVFTVGTASSTNSSGTNYITYLFTTLSGVSKVGSYTGTGATQTIDCGFTGGARFVLVKRTDTTGDWYVWDTARGMTAGTDPYILYNSTAAEVNANNIYTTGVGFQIVGTGAGINASGGTYIYLAIA